MIFGLPDEHPAAKEIRRLEEIEHAVRARFDLGQDATDVEILSADLMIVVALNPDKWERVPGTNRFRAAKK
jgi:hypothetical protein